ncbi:MAG: hypothetical protein K0R50_421 [Eubacterium sp.]|nr:hypothetical protein [Eubacterium sp.]
MNIYDSSGDIILETFIDVNLAPIANPPIIVVYNSPKDYPGKYVARLWNIKNKPTRMVVLSDSLAEIKKMIPVHMILVPPVASDDSVIVGSYI